MGVSWQTPDQKAFIDNHIPSYIQHLADGTVKSTFWPGFFDEWFEAWPLPEPSSDQVEEKGGTEKAAKEGRIKKIGVSTIYPLMIRLVLTIHAATEAHLQSGWK